MERIRFTLCAAALAALCLLCASTAQAQLSRTWVSGTGDDSNTCSRTAPCKTFAGAQAKTLEGGEISILDSGNYIAITITKSLTINGAGALAGIIAPNTHGVVVNVMTNPSTSTVVLRNLQINGGNTGLNGIRFLAGKSLVVDNCRIHGFRNGPNQGRGIDVQLATDGELKVIDTVIEDVTVDGIRMTTSAGQLLVTINRTRIMGCDGDGIEAADRVRAEITDSVITHNPNGIVTTGTDSILSLDDVFVAYAAVGLSGGGPNSEIRVSDSVIAQNVTGVSGNVHSLQGNSLMGNTAPGSFVTAAAKQ